MTEPTPPSHGTPTGEGHLPRPASPLHWRLTDLLDREMLQSLQDGFAQLTKMAASIRDEQGHHVTRPSCSHRFCELIGGPLHDNEACRLSNYAAAAAAGAANQDSPIKYVCHAQLVQYAAAIRLEGRVLGTIVLGDLPEKPLEPAEVAELARLHHVPVEALQEAARELPPSSDERMRSAIEFLQLLANTLTRLCYQQVILEEQIDELTLLSETSRLLSSALDPDAVLNNIVRTMAEIMSVKACTMRLLNDAGDELVMKATYGLSPTYLKKGPVLVAENPNDQAALRGEVITINDMRTDPRVRYPEEAKREGLVSSLAVGLIAQGKPLGTLHIYTAGSHSFTPEEVRLFRSIANQAALAVHNADLLEEVVQGRQQARELALAAKVQKRMLPAAAPTVPGYDCYGVTQPSQQVGGDFHDWIPLPEENWGLAVGDVAGKGVPAAILMASIHAALRAQAEHIYELDHIMDHVNRGLVAETEVSEFVTLFYGVLDSRAKKITCTSAGHEPALLVRNGQITRLSAGGPLLGVSEEATYQYETVALQSGDALVVYSDGACDAANFKGEHFGRERLLDSIRRHSVYGARRMVEEIQWDIRRFTGLAPRMDDLTLLVLKVL